MNDDHDNAQDDAAMLARYSATAPEFGWTRSDDGENSGLPAWDLGVDSSYYVERWEVGCYAAWHDDLTIGEPGTYGTLAEAQGAAEARYREDRLEYLRAEIRAERISSGEIAELQALAGHIESGDTELLQWAGVPESPEGGANDDDRWFIVVIREDDGTLNAISRRQPDPDGKPFAGPWGAMTEAEASELSRIFNEDDARKGGTAEITELFRYDRDPVWPDQYA